MDRLYEQVELIRVIDRRSREHSPVPDQLRLDGLSVDLDLDSALVGINRDQPAGSVICSLMHCLFGDVLYVLEETTISYYTDFNAR